MSTVSAAAVFEPNAQDLEQACQLLQALRDPLRSDHGLAMHTLNTHAHTPSFALHMLFLFAHGERLSLAFDLRQLAGLVVKNFVFPHLLALPAEAQQRVREELLVALCDPAEEVRHTAALLLGRVAVSFAVAEWADLLPPLLARLEVHDKTQINGNIAGNEAFFALDGALQAVKTLAEDCALKLVSLSVLEALLPRLLSLLTHTVLSVRLRALETYHSLLHLLESQDNGNNAHSADPYHVNSQDFASHEIPKTQSGPAELAMKANAPLLLHMNAFIQCLSVLASDTERSVRKCVCASLTTIAYLHIACLEPYFASILQFMGLALQDADEEVAMESCEFWSALLRYRADTAVRAHVEGSLPVVLPALLSRLTLTEEQMLSERREEEEQNSGRKALQIKPMHHRSDEEGRGQTDEDEVSSKWTLRKQAAQTLDAFAVAFDTHTVLSLTLPHIHARLQSSDALQRESAVLALGALSEGCAAEGEMYAHWAQLLPALTQCLCDTMPEMRSIACWVLGRYSGLYAEMYNREMRENESEEQHNAMRQQGVTLYLQTTHALMQSMRDAHVKVQVAACSALCVCAYNSFSASAGEIALCAQMPPPAYPDDERNVLSVALPALLNAVTQAYTHYGVKSSMLLVDLLGTLADTLREDFGQCSKDLIPAGATMPAFQEALFRAFFSITDDTDFRLFPYLECLTSLCAVCGETVRDAVLPLYQRCLRLLQKAMPRRYNPEHDDGDEPLDMDFAVCALDVMAALSEGLSVPLFVSLLQSTQTAETVFSLTLHAIESDLSSAELRQSAFSLMGELCKLSRTHSWQTDPSTNQSVPVDEKSIFFSPALSAHVLQCCTQHIDESLPFVCNNAAWALGELVRRLNSPAMLRPVVQNALDRLVYALHSHELQDNLKVNLAVTLCRIASVCTEESALLAEDFFSDLCHTLTLPCPYAEKRDAWRGLLSLLTHTTELVLGRKPCMYALCLAAISWADSVSERERERVRAAHAQSNAEEEREREKERAEEREMAQGVRAVLVAMQSHNNALWLRVLNSLANNGHSVQTLAQAFS